MIRIDLDLSPALARLTGAPEGVLARAGRLAAKVAAERYTEETLDWIRAGRSFRPRTGLLEQSIDWRPTADGAEVFAGGEAAPYAAPVEFGSEPHRIGPRPGRQALRFFAGGAMLIRRSVQHPGSKPRPFFYADRERREARLLDAARGTVADVLTGER